MIGLRSTPTWGIYQKLKGAQFGFPGNKFQEIFFTRPNISYITALEIPKSDLCRLT